MDWSKPWRVLLWTFAAAVAYSLAASALPALATFPLFDWVGLPAATAWGWSLSPALGYVGQVGNEQIRHTYVGLCRLLLAEMVRCLGRWRGQLPFM
jgi:hypothetical protein